MLRIKKKAWKGIGRKCESRIKYIWRAREDLTEKVTFE